MNADDLTSLNEQIAGMARAGLPLDQGLEGLARDMGRGRLKAVTEGLARDLRAGCSLPEALDRQKGRVPAYYANLVTAGVQTGRLPDVLATLTTYARTVSTTRTIVVDALFYPTIVLVFGAMLFAVLAVYVLPQFNEIFHEFGLKLPAITEAVMFFGQNPRLLLLIPAAVVGTIVVFGLMIALSGGERRGMARVVYRVPLVGSLIRAARLAAFTELLAMLVEYELPLPAAFRLAGAASSDPVMAAQAAQVEEQLSRGVPLGEAFRGRGLVPEWVAWMAGAGQQRNALAASLRQIAAIYRRQVDARASLLRSVLPPVIVLFTAGVLTGVFAVAIMLPMVKLLEGLSK